MKVNEIGIKGELVECGAINLILGANNTGKSTFINELEQTICNCQLVPAYKWISAVNVSHTRTKARFNNLFPAAAAKLSDYQKLSEEISKDGRLRMMGLPWNQNVLTWLNGYDDGIEFAYTIDWNTTASHPRDAIIFFNKLSTSIEKCDSRLKGPFSAQVNQITDPYESVVSFLYAEDSVFNLISDHINEIFGLRIEFDDLKQGLKHIRLAPKNKPLNFESKRKQAEFWLENSALIESQGDGLKAYLRILYSIFDPHKDIIIIDEPEAFLHSPQRRALGKFIAENAQKGKQIFIATHDSEFLRGIVANTSSDLKIFHLKYENESIGCHVHVLSSTGKPRNYNERILNSYFNRLTVLCEAEDDRMIYQYASETYFPSKSVDVHFIGLNGKKEIFSTLKRLRELTIKAAVIVDIDILYSGEYAQIIDDITDKQLLDEVKQLLSQLSKEGKDALKRMGTVWIQDSANREKVVNAIEICKRHSIHIVSVGVLENWIDTTNQNGKGRIIQHIRGEIEAARVGEKKQLLKAFVEGILNEA